MNDNLSWSFFQVWNESLGTREERTLTPREHIWAGEIGGSYLDRYLKMTAVKPTNPPNARSLRKFEAGNLMEWVVKLVLQRAGMLRDSQKWIEYQYPGLARVTGRLDHLAGGKVDWSKAQKEIKALELPEFFNRATTKIVSYLSEKYPGGMSEVILEVKSLSSFQFDMRERLKLPQTGHQLQLFHYLKSLNMTEGHIVYICRDDLRMLEFGVFNPSTIEEVYKKDIETMTNFIKTKTLPEKEKEILFDEEACRFSKNWKVEYSSYLKHIYGYEQPENYREVWDKKVAQFNRVFGRCVRDEKMTPLNLEVIKDIEVYFTNWRDYIPVAKELLKKGLIEEEQEA